MQLATSCLCVKDGTVGLNALNHHHVGVSIDGVAALMPSAPPTISSSIRFRSDRKKKKKRLKLSMKQNQCCAFMLGEKLNLFFFFLLHYHPSYFFNFRLITLTILMTGNCFHRICCHQILNNQIPMRTVYFCIDIYSASYLYCR